jgi:hypothetical protein
LAHQRRERYVLIVYLALLVLFLVMKLIRWRKI